MRQPRGLEWACAGRYWRLVCTDCGATWTRENGDAVVIDHVGVHHADMLCLTLHWRGPGPEPLAARRWVSDQLNAKVESQRVAGAQS